MGESDPHINDREFPQVCAMIRFLFASIALLSVGAIARADLIVYEPFNYAAGTDLSGLGGGTGFAPGSIWSGGANYDVGAGSLSRPGLASDGNRVTSTAQLSGVTQATRRLGQFLNTGTFYMSFLARPEGTLGEGAFNGFFGLYLDSFFGSPGPDIFVGKPGNAANAPWSLEFVGGGSSRATNYRPVVGQTDLLVTRWNLDADTVTLWVNPALGSEPTSFDAQLQVLTVNLTEIGGMTLYSTGAHSLDEIRIGTAYADVVPAAVPEPSSAALLGLLGIAGAVWRRRRLSRSR